MVQVVQTWCSEERSCGAGCAIPVQRGVWLWCRLSNPGAARSVAVVQVEQSRCSDESSCGAGCAIPEQRGAKLCCRLCKPGAARSVAVVQVVQSRCSEECGCGAYPRRSFKVYLFNRRWSSGHLRFFLFLFIHTRTPTPKSRPQTSRRVCGGEMYAETVMPLNSQAQLPRFVRKQSCLLQFWHNSGMKIAKAGKVRGLRGLVACILYEMSYNYMGLKGDYRRFV